MREYSVPATSEVGPDSALTDMLAENVEKHGDEVGLRIQRGGRWEDVTWRQFGEQVAGVAKGLVAAGVQPGDRVALQAKTRYEWPVIDFAIWTAGAVTVPVYETSSPDQVAWILADSGAVAAVVERAEHAAAVDSVRDQAPDLGPLDDRGRGAGVGEDPGDLVGAGGLVHRDGDGARRPDGEVDERPLVAGLGLQGDAVTGLHAGGDQPLGDAGDLLAELPPGDVLPPAVPLDAQPDLVAVLGDVLGQHVGERLVGAHLGRRGDAVLAHASSFLPARPGRRCPRSTAGHVPRIYRGVPTSE